MAAIAMAEDARAIVAALAAEPLDDDDVALLHAIRSAYERADPVPDGLAERLVFEVTLDELHAEIAQLEWANDPVLARGQTAELQAVTFTSPTATIMLTIAPSGTELVRLDGWVAPGAHASVELQGAAESALARADDDGRFVFADVPRGSVRLVIRRFDGPAPAAVVTPTFEL